MRSHYALSRVEFERALDSTLAGSFPASDPPPWTLGVAAADDFFSATIPAPVPASIDVVIAEGPRFGRGLAVIAEAIGLAAMVPVAILIAGLPVIVLIWSVARAVAWLWSIG